MMLQVHVNEKIVDEKEIVDAVKRRMKRTGRSASAVVKQMLLDNIRQNRTGKKGKQAQ